MYKAASIAMVTMTTTHIQISTDSYNYVIQYCNISIYGKNGATARLATCITSYFTISFNIVIIPNITDPVNYYSKSCNSIYLFNLLGLPQLCA